MTDTSEVSRRPNESASTHGWKSWAISATLVAIGLLLTSLAVELGKNTDISHSVWYQFLTHVATAFLIAGIWHGIDSFLLRKSFAELISGKLKEQIFSLSKNVDEIKIELQNQLNPLRAKIHDISDQIHASRHERALGFLHSHAESHAELYEEMIVKSNLLTMVFHNGEYWTRTHRENLKERLADPNKMTRIVLLKPDSGAAHLIEKKELMKRGAYIEKIQETLSIISGLLAVDSKLEIYTTSFHMGQAIFLTESIAYVIPRFILDFAVPPVFIFEKNDHKKSYYKKLNEDLEHLIRHPDTEKLDLSSVQQDALPDARYASC